MSAVRTTCPYCGVGCGLRITHTAGGIEVTGDESHPANFGRLCSKGSALAETIDLDGRLLHPEIDGRPVSWDAALGLVADRFRAAIAAHGPESVAFYVSGQLLTEDYYVANKLMKGYIGGANIDTNSRLCMASAVAGYKRAFGADHVPASYADIDAADLVVISGSNMAWCHPVLFQRLRQAREERSSLRVVVIDPRRTATADIADMHLAVKPGTDVMLFNGLLDYLRRENAIDAEYVEARTEGFSEAARTAEETAPSIADVARVCELAEQEIAGFYALFARTPRTVTLFSQGVNQSTSGSDKVNAIVNVHLATGRIARPGAGPFSLTGQPNAMGGREVGGLANQLAAHMDFSPANCERVQRFWRSPRIAAAEGLRAVDLFTAAGAGKIRALWIISTNPVVSMPDADAVRAALDACEFVVVSDCMRRTDTTSRADVLLPAAAWGEKAGTVTNSERRISRQRAFLEAPGDARPDWQIVCDLARRMGYASDFDYAGPADIFREHAALSAFENDGSRDFDIGALATISDAGYESLEPLRWPAPVGRRKDIVASGIVPAERTFQAEREPLASGRFFTPTGKARFIPTTPVPPADAPDEKFPFVMLTGRSRDQWHTMTRTGKSPRLAQTRPEPCVEIHPRDALALNLANGCLASITSARGRMLARVDWNDALRRGEIFVPMHWTAEQALEGRVGPLIAPAVDRASGQPELKATPVRLEPVGIDWYGFVLSRERMSFVDVSYAVVTRGAGYWRHELAGTGDVRDFVGRVRRELGGAGDWLEYADARSGNFRCARLIDGRLQSCLFVSPRTRLPDRAWLGRLFDISGLGEAERASLLAGRPADGSADSGPIICACHSVGRDALIRAISSQALTSVREIGNLLRAGTNCGSCIPELNALLAEHGPASCGQVLERHQA